MEMTQNVNIMEMAIGVVLRISAPVLLLSLIVGVAVAILQAVTQIHEQSIAFVVKLIVLVLILIVGGKWMLHMLQEFTLQMFDLMV